MADIDRAIYQIQRDDEETVTRKRASELSLQYINLVGYPILPQTLKLIPLDDLLKFKIVPFLHVDQKVRIAVVTPAPEIVSYIQQFANTHQLEVSLSLCSESSYNFAASIYLREESAQAKEVQIQVDAEAQKQAMSAITSAAELAERLTKANATEVLDLLFAGATGMEASDIHLEPQADAVRVRFRIDGVLQEITQLNAAVYKQVVSRVKFLANIKLDIKQVNQDGRFTIALADTSLDVRVSTLPSSYGEVIDMRLLRAHDALLKLNDLGLRADALQMIMEAIALPHGMILITGPTGSGKTTTLYAILDHLNSIGSKLVTLEDPVEYKLPGIDQVQIETEKGFTFAEALKGVLRQDPDIIMVGEIRDKETADIGLQAAMTGHLFLSTLHTNNAPSSLARMLDMGVEAYKLNGAINLIVAQRLVRKICTTCQGAGCDTCHKTGFKGRMPIIEVLKPSKTLDEAVINKASVRELYALAVKEGMVPMHTDGMQKVAQGLTTADEVNRVTAEVADK